MADERDQTIGRVYRLWKAGRPPEELHPDEEIFVCFIEGRLPPDQARKVAAHLMSCAPCGAMARAHLVAQPPAQEPPAALMEKIRALLGGRLRMIVMDLVVRLKETALEVISASGDVLVGQEVIPAAVLRSRQVKDFKDSLTVFKDFPGIRLELKAEIKDRGLSLHVLARDKQTQEPASGLRISLLRDELELESYLPETGQAVFERLRAGRFSIEVASLKEKLASVLIEIRE